MRSHDHDFWHAGGHAAVAVIVDPAAVEDVKYTRSYNSTANCTIPCDPVIHNVP
jgi:hypothetical protein